MCPTFFLLAFHPSWAESVQWPPLDEPAPVVTSLSGEAAVVVGIEAYATLPPVPGARANAEAWFDYFTRTRQISPDRVILLRDSDATVETIREAARNAARVVEPGAKLWFVFIGHGAPRVKRPGSLLIGWDTQQKAKSLEVRSLARSELLQILANSLAESVPVFFDACFSGRTPDGKPLIEGLQPLVVAAQPEKSNPKLVIFSAARDDEFAGPLLGVPRPAFSYLTLGALRGWADSNRDGVVSAGEIHDYTERTIRATIRDRVQRPGFTGDSNISVSFSAGEMGPDIVALAKGAAQKKSSKETQPKNQITRQKRIPKGNNRHEARKNSIPSTPPVNPANLSGDASTPIWKIGVGIITLPLFAFFLWWVNPLPKRIPQKPGPEPPPPPPPEKKFTLPINLNQMGANEFKTSLVEVLKLGTVSIDINDLHSMKLFAILEIYGLIAESEGSSSCIVRKEHIKFLQANFERLLKLKCEKCGKLLGAPGIPVPIQNFIRHLMGKKKSGGHEMEQAEAEQTAQSQLSREWSWPEIFKLYST